LASIAAHAGQSSSPVCSNSVFSFAFFMCFVFRL
jgi:hypothetical protein